MWPAIILLWLNLLWTLVCLLFYRDRTLILEASVPAWIISLLLWLMLWSPVSIFKITRWWSGKRAVGTKKKTAPRSNPRARQKGARRRSKGGGRDT